MLYFRNTFHEIQKSATYATKGFQLLGGCAPAGLCPWIPLGAQPQTSDFPPMFAIPPKPRVSG